MLHFPFPQLRTPPGCVCFLLCSLHSITDLGQWVKRENANNIGSSAQRVDSSDSKLQQPKGSAANKHLLQSFQTSSPVDCFIWPRRSASRGNFDLLEAKKYYRKWLFHWTKNARYMSSGTSLVFLPGNCLIWAYLKKIPANVFISMTV